MFSIDYSIYTATLLAIAAPYVILMIAPGPDFALVIRNSLLYSRRAGLFCVMGTVTGMCFHITYTLLGLAYLLKKYPWAQTSIQLAGATYLLYLGYKSITSKRAPISELDFEKKEGDLETLTPFQAYRTGLFSNALNPMVSIMFLSIISPYIDTTTPLAFQVILVCMMLSLTISWFSFVAIFFSDRRVREQFFKLGKWLERLTGGVLIFLGIKIFATAARIF